MMMPAPSSMGMCWVPVLATRSPAAAEDAACNPAEMAAGTITSAFTHYAKVKGLPPEIRMHNPPLVTRLRVRKSAQESHLHMWMRMGTG